MTAMPYIPAGGVAGKLRRLTARAFGVSVLPIRLDRSIVTITFDDFPKSAATTGAEILERRGWRGTYFASGGFAGGANHHGALFDAADLHRLQANGHEIACHTFAHGDASQAGLDITLEDATRNRRFLEAAGHEAPLETFAFPFGEATPAAKTALLGRYRALRGVRPGINRGRADRGLLKATPLDGGEAGLAQAAAAVRDAARGPGWLIFFGHDVQDTPTEWGCTPAFLETVCAEIEACGLDVQTMRDALDTIEARP